MTKKFFGIIIPYATIITKSKSKFLKYSYSDLLFFNLSGVLTSKLIVSANECIGDFSNFCPLLDFLGGCVYTAEIS